MKGLKNALFTEGVLRHCCILIKLFSVKIKINLHHTNKYVYIYTMIDTRKKILGAMFKDVHKNGFQGLRADKVIKDLDVTKGALYHYFSSKEAIGLAIIDEMIEPSYLKFYDDLDVFEGNPIDMLRFHLKDLSRHATHEEICLGCPLNNLVQEMSPINEDFREKLKGVVEKMTFSITNALNRGIMNGYVKKGTDAQAVAEFYFSGIEGSFSIAKVHRNPEMFKSNMKQLSLYLDILRG
jgi:TetR/AcrR family transcriptional regulator, transcriptional repressor for nem operon